MVDDETFLHETARFYGFSEEDAIAARDLLDLPERDYVARFNALAYFARTFGVNIKDLAVLISEGTGIEPFEPRYQQSEEDRRRVNEAIRDLGQEGHWAETILKLLDELDRLREEGSRS